jgi:hypothetical protein
MSELNSTRLRELLTYDPATGIFTWRIGRKGRSTKAGARAGRPHVKGYEWIGVDGERIMAHRIAWCYTHGYWPPHQIDHINGDRADNRLSNLRLATPAENLQNKRHPNGANPYRGVRNSHGRWQASIYVNKKFVHLGMFDTPEDARDAYIRAKRVHHTFNTL